MTPIKAAAEPSREALLALAQELRCARAETLGLNGKIRMPIELIVHCEAVLSKLAAAPAGNASDVLAEIWRLCDSSGHLSKREIVGQIAALVEANTRAAPAENGGAVQPTEEQLLEWVKWLDWDTGLDTDDEVRQLRKLITRFIAPALSPPQPREAEPDEIKRADAAPPEASFDNASDMLGYLNAPREAEEEIERLRADRDKWHRIAMEAGAVTCTNGGHIYPLKDEVKLLRAQLSENPPQPREAEPVAWIVLSEETGNTRIWWRDKERAEVWAATHNLPLIPLYASPSPIPEAPEVVRLSEVIDEQLCAIGIDDDELVEKFVEAICTRFEVTQIRALKPQDGGNCEHGIAKVNCGICVPSKVFSGESGR